MTKKQLLEKIKELENALNSSTTEFLTAQDMMRNLQIQVAQARASILDDSKDTQVANSEYDEISKNIIPQGWSWMYWKFINQLTFYWLGRYSNYESEDKTEIELCKYIAIMYGIAGFSKSQKKAYYVSTGKTPDTYLCFPAESMINPNGMYKSSIVDGKTKQELTLDASQGIELPKSDIVLCKWRIGDIGNYIWYLQDSMYFLLTKQIVICNAGNLTNPLYIKVNNKAYLKSQEYKKLLSPLSNVKAIVNTGEMEIPSKSNMVGNFSASLDKDANRQNYANELILTTKFIQEQFYTIFGIPLSSSKNQSLSADANLSVTLCNNIAKEHDKWIEKFHKEIGIQFNIEEFDDMQPQNENADKDGQGVANTDGDKVEKESK